MTKVPPTFPVPEIAAMATMAGALDPLAEDERTRVLAWARSRYATGASSPGPPQARGELVAKSTTRIDAFSTLGELMAACSADADDRRVLVASVFVAQRNNEGAFTAAQVNAELKHLGHPVQNITRALDALIAQRPALVVQVRKSGSTRQARKLFKITDAGTQELRRMLTDAD